MGRWIAALLILIVFIIPASVIFALPQQPLADMAFSWFTPKDAAVLSQKFVDDVRVKNFKPVAKALESQFVTPETPAQLAKVATLFPKETPRNIKRVGANTMIRPGVTAYNFTYEYEFSRSWVLASIVLDRDSDGLRIFGLRVRPMATSLEQLNALTFTGKSQIYYLFAATALAVFIFWVVSVYTPV
jgi:hypothetical protein